MVSNNNELILDWDEITKQIVHSDNPNGPIHLIKTCLESNQESDPQDPYDQIDKHLDLFIENLRKSFIELNR